MHRKQVSLFLVVTIVIMTCVINAIQRQQEVSEARLQYDAITMFLPPFGRPPPLEASYLKSAAFFLNVFLINVEFKSKSQSGTREAS